MLATTTTETAINLLLVMARCIRSSLGGLAFPRTHHKVKPGKLHMGVRVAERMSETAARNGLTEKLERDGWNIGSIFMATWWQKNTPANDSSGTPRDVAYPRIGGSRPYAGGSFLKRRRRSIDRSLISCLKRDGCICRRGLARAYLEPTPAGKTLVTSLD